MSDASHVTVHDDACGGRVTVVGPGAAFESGLRAGDVVCAVDGVPVRDVIDWWWATDAPAFVLRVMRGAEPVELRIERKDANPLGVQFHDVLFDGVRQCDNACTFCFISGLPPGLRPALYVRDDDFRLSFLSGNFVTLTNVTDDDLGRIVEQRLSPLHVSIHAVDPGVRSRLICPTANDDALAHLETLLDAGIEVHVQIVLVPGVNDGPVLAETLAYLFERPGVVSVGCVPMGYTRHQHRWTGSYTPDQARRVLDALDTWQSRARKARGSGWVYAADEFYLLAGVAIPPVGHYDDFPQYENGIGMTAAFLDELPAIRAAGSSTRITVVTGELFAPVVSTALASRGLSDIGVLAVPNHLFGGNVSVTGLLSGQDIGRTVREAEGLAAREGRAGGTYLVPDVVVNSDGLLIDDVPADSLGEVCGADVRIIESHAGALASALTSGEEPGGP